jgi:hypothetical protein
MSLYTIREGVDNHPEATVLQHLSDITKKGGVLNPSSDFLVGEHGAGGLNVDVAAGRAIVKISTTARPVRSTATEVIEINPNTSGNPRITSIVLYVDISLTPTSDGQGADVTIIEAVDGTPGASPVAKTNSEIQSIVGANNPFIRLADITVPSGATGISSGDIANSLIRAHLHTPTGRHLITYAATITPEYLDANQQYCTLTNDVTVADPTNMEIGDFLELEFIQDGTGGWEVTWFGTITWLSADTSMNTDPDKHTVYVIEKTGADTYNGYMAGKEY